MNVNSLTIKAQEALQAAYTLAQQRGQQAIEPLHMLSVLIRDDDALCTFLLGRVGVNVRGLRDEADRAVGSLPQVTGGNGEQYFSQDASRVIQRAVDFTKTFGDKYASVEHLLLGLIAERGAAADLLKRAGATEKELIEAIRTFRKGATVDSQTASQEFNALGKYAVNLNEQARSGKLDPVIGRDEEIRRVLQILSRRTKNNPILVGEAGVGKTAIAEGIAQRIAEGQVPARLRDKEIFLLDMTALIAGTQFRGQFEQRVKGLISEVKAAGNIILFIDEIHSIVGAGDSDGAMNAANILKPALSRGQVQVIGATTFAEYRKYIEKDTALERRFQPVKVEEPSISDTIEVLKGIRIYYEKHHCVRVPDPVVTNVVKLSERYITDRFLPDKAIDLLDEACSDVNLHNKNLMELALKKKEKADLELEQDMIQQQSTEAEARRGLEINEKEKEQARIRQEITELNQERLRIPNEYYEQIQRDICLKQNQEKIDDANQRLDDLTKQLQELRAQDYQQYAQVAMLRSKIIQVEEAIQSLKALPKPELTVENLANVVEQWTGIPASRIEESEFERLSKLDERLKEHIIGQDQAVHAVASAIKRARADLSGRHRPASFIFVGPTGVGKTELVKQLANQLFDTVDPLISIDMSEYMEKYAVSRLIGSPPGYVGYDEAGQLTEKVRRHPYSVVLFDEIEKAHPDVMNILLQILDEGKINDAQGRVVDFSNTVICMTSNAGSTDQSGATGFGKRTETASADKCMKALQEFLRPEFLGRVDEVITFRPLSESDLERIAQLMLDEYKPGLAAHSITLNTTPEALAAIVAESTTRYGARELRRTIRKAVEDPISEALVDGRLGSQPAAVTLTAKDGKPVLEL